MNVRVKLGIEPLELLIWLNVHFKWVLLNEDVQPNILSKRSEDKEEIRITETVL
jgi:hypothetical protein